MSERALADYFPVLKWVSTNECSYQRKLCPVCFVGWRIVKIGVMAFVSQSLGVYSGGWKALTACDVSEARLINIDTGQGGKEAPISFCRKKLKRKSQNVSQYRKQFKCSHISTNLWCGKTIAFKSVKKYGRILKTMKRLAVLYESL